MAKAYIMALVKFTDKEKFMADYGSKVADVFKHGAEVSGIARIQLIRLFLYLF